jgi:hypothetical protein
VLPDEQLEWERRAGRTAGLAAIAASIFLFVGGLVYPSLAANERRDSAAEVLRSLNDNPADAIVPGILQTIGYLALAYALYYLYRATKARREELLGATRYLAVIGPIATAVAFMGHQIVILQAAGDFVDEQLPERLANPAGGLAAQAGLLLVNEDVARDLVQDKTGAPILVAVQYGGVLCVAFAFVLLGMNAMRAGLLSRFMGYLAIAIGVLTVLAIFGPIGVVVQIFWLGAVGLIFLDRWPNGRGPAWEVVEAIPWPSAMEQRAALERERAGDEYDEGEDAAEEEEYDEDEELEEEEDLEPEPAPHPVSKKRKKKKRRR